MGGWVDGWGDVNGWGDVSANNKINRFWALRPED